MVIFEFKLSSFTEWWRASEPRLHSRGSRVRRPRGPRSRPAQRRRRRGRRQGQRRGDHQRDHGVGREGANIQNEMRRELCFDMLQREQDPMHYLDNIEEGTHTYEAC